MSRARAGWAVLGWSGGFGASLWALVSLGSIEWLQIDWSNPVGWLGRVETEVALAAIARLAGLALVVWMALSTLVYLAARVGGIRPGAVDWLSIGPLRRAIDALLAGTLVVTTMAPAGAAIDPVGEAATSTTTIAAVDPSYIPVPAGPQAMTAETDANPDLDTAGPEPEAAVDPPVEAHEPTTVTVAIGDHFWNLAQAHLARVLGYDPTDAQIAPYWARVVETNRDRILSGDPDVIFPGEEIVLPAVDLDG